MPKSENIDINSLKKAVDILKNGGIVALPTETVYGLAVIYNNEEAKRKLIQLKGRPPDKPFTLAVDDPEKAWEIFSPLPPFAYRIGEKLWPGPLTIVYYLRESEDKIGIRVPAHNLVISLIQELNSPIWLTSANKSGDKTVMNIKELEETFPQGIDLILEGETPYYQEPSTVIDLTYQPFKVIRPGSVDYQSLMQLFIRKRLVFVCTGNTCRSPMAEYILKSRLSEKYPLLLQRYEIISRGINALPGGKITKEAEEILRIRNKLDAIPHYSMPIDKHVLRSSDIIIVMTQKQKEYLISLDETLFSRVFLLGDFLPYEVDNKDIEDPIGQPIEFYEKVYEKIFKAIEGLIEWL